MNVRAQEPLGVRDLASGVGRSMWFRRRSRRDAVPLADTTGAADWGGVLDRIGVKQADRDRLLALARSNGTSFRAELLASGLVDDAALNEAVAAEIGVPVASDIDPEALVVRDADCLALLRQRTITHPAMIRGADGDSAIAIAPDRPGPARLARFFVQAPHLRARFRAVAPSRMRTAALARAGPLLARQAVHGLANRFPHLSARIVANAWQGFVVGVSLVGIPVALLVVPNLTFAVAHALFSFFFLACVSLRFAAVKAASPFGVTKLSRVRAADLPTYSVLVALHKEAEIVPDLLEALGRLQWPRSKLEIKLVCEADDVATLTALRAHRLPAYLEIVEVPNEGPRTKPKALSYALPTISGEFVVLFDAEDRPHPWQLLEAWQAFRKGPPDLACLQAPLDIANSRAGAIPAMFAFEYSALFRGLLPFLAAGGLLLPLGGTSNHFRRSVLEEVGAWDPYNVTEDADLGIRLLRFGYRTGTITRSTLEDAPVSLRDWLPQRTRWFKGWCQTWLVHMREPRRLWRELGPASFLIAQILFLGMVVSSLVHPLLVVGAGLLTVKLALGMPLSTGQSVLLLVDVANVVCGYTSFLLLGWQTLAPRARRAFWRVVLWTPIYWMLMSAAAWRAVWQLWRNPHLWEKTPHPRPVAAAATKPSANSPGTPDPRR